MPDKHVVSVPDPLAGKYRFVGAVNEAEDDFDAVVNGYAREFMPTGLFSGGEVNIVGGGLDVEVLTGLGGLIDQYTNPIGPAIITELSWPDLQHTITTPTTNLIAWIMLQESATPGIAEIVELATRPTPTDQRNLIYIGLITWDGAAWHDVSTPIAAGNLSHQFYEMIKDVFPPLFFVTGGNVGEVPGFMLDIDTSVIWEANRNHHVDPRDPNRQAFGPISPLVFRYITGGFEDVGAPGSVIDPTQWENPTGVLDPTIGGGVNTATIQRLWLDQADNFWITWGQVVYSTFDEARASVNADAANSTFSTFLSRDCILLGFIVSSRTEADWGAGDAEFIPFVTGQVGGGGGAAITAYLGLTDTPSDYVGAARQVEVVADDELSLIHEPRMNWKNVWAPGEYRTQEVTRDGDWLMVANKTTIDRPAPQPTGTPIYTVPDAPVWTVNQFTGVVQSGLRIQGVTRLWAVLNLRVWVQGTTADDHYRVVTEDNISGSIDVGQEFDGDVLASPGWFAVSSIGILAPGDDISIYLLHENSAGTTDFNHPWAVIASGNQDLDPGLGNLNWSNQLGRLRINEEDDDGMDRSLELASVTSNTTIRVVDEDDLNVYITFEVLGSTNQGGWWQYDVVLIDTGTGGTPPLGRSDVFFQVPVAAPTDYVELAGVYTGHPVLSGFLQLGQGAPVEDDKSYGVDIRVQEYIPSLDWDLMSHT